MHYIFIFIHRIINYSIENKEFPHPDCIKDWESDMKLWPPIEFPLIFNYFIRSKCYDHEEMQNYKSLEAYNYFSSGKVGEILHFVFDTNMLILKANVQPSQTLSSGDHRAWVCVTKNGEEILLGN